MLEPDLIGYIGMGTGIIGAITGISGAIMGYVSYRRSKSLKSLDLRIELRKAINVAQSDLQQLEKLIEYGNKFRERVASATGKFKRMKFSNEGPRQHTRNSLMFSSPMPTATPPIMA